MGQQQKERDHQKWLRLMLINSFVNNSPFSVSVSPSFSLDKFFGMRYVDVKPNSNDN